MKLILSLIISLTIFNTHASIGFLDDIEEANNLLSANTQNGTYEERCLRVWENYNQCIGNNPQKESS